jgi:TolA-binding protein
MFAPQVHHVEALQQRIDYLERRLDEREDAVSWLADQNFSLQKQHAELRLEIRRLTSGADIPV